MKPTNSNEGTDTQTSNGEAVRSSDWLGRAAWTAYRRAVGGVAWNGDKLPEWEEMLADPKKEQIVAAWKEAARAVALLVNHERIRQFTAEGWAGVLGNGNIVDRRVHPDAVPIPANSLLGVPEPKRPSDKLTP